MRAPQIVLSAIVLAGAPANGQPAPSDAVRAECERSLDVALQLTGDGPMDAASRSANLDACVAMPPEVRACFSAVKAKEDLARCNAARNEALRQQLVSDNVVMALFMPGAVLPSEIGPDLAPTTDARLQLVWSYQIPFGLFDSETTGPAGCDALACTPERGTPLWRHRIVLAFAVATTSDFRADVRAGYRYRAVHAHGIAPFIGLGGTYGNTTTGTWRAAISPEVGVHLGGSQLFEPGFQLRLQADIFPDAPHTRFLLTVGYTLL